MHIPDRLMNKIIKTYGNKGERWLRDVPNIYDEAVGKWRLSSLELSSILSYNLVCFAESPDFGEVALKMGVPHPELFTEMKALSLYDGRHICRLYDFDENLGAMLLQRIRPGVDLTTVAENNERVRIAADLVIRLPISVNNAHGLPQYYELVYRAFTRSRNEGKVDSAMLLLVERAEESLVALRARSSPDMLLHGDLNHWNILRDKKDQWLAIDPKGMIGPRSMECGRFVINELEIVPRAQRQASLEGMISAFAHALEETEADVAMSIFIDRIVSTLWSFEENTTPEKLERSVDNCMLVWESTKRMI